MRATCASLVTSGKHVLALQQWYATTSSLRLGRKSTTTSQLETNALLNICTHSLSLSSQAYIGDAAWELALRSRELDTARALTGVRPRVAARARAEYQATALRELEKSGSLSTEEQYVSLSLSLTLSLTRT